MSMIRRIRLKIIQDELFNLYRDAHEAWSWAEKGPAHKRFAEKIEERIKYLEERFTRLSHADVVE